MSHEHEMTIDAVDADGAVREAAQRVGHTRAGFIARSALTGGGVVAGGAALTSLVPAASAQSGLSTIDRDILNFALTLEELEAAFYADAQQKAGLSGEAQSLAKTAGAHETAHVAAIRKLLGSAAIAKPTFDFGSATASQAAFLKTAVVLEDTGVAAYKGQAPKVRSRAVLSAALGIHATEAKHAAWARLLAGQNPIPTGLDQPLSKAQVLAAVKKTGFITG